MKLLHSNLEDVKEITRISSPLTHTMIYSSDNNEGSSLVGARTLRDNSVDEIYASHFFEHLYPHAVVNLLIQVERVLKKGGKLWIIVPHKDHERANVIWHRTYFTEFTFIDMAKYINFEIKELVTNSRMDIHCKMIKI